MGIECIKGCETISYTAYCSLIQLQSAFNSDPKIDFGINLSHLIPDTAHTLLPAGDFRAKKRRAITANPFCRFIIITPRLLRKLEKIEIAILGDPQQQFPFQMTIMGQLLPWEWSVSSRTIRFFAFPLGNGNHTVFLFL